MSDVAAVIAPIALAHMVGDYLIQSDWMAQEKTRRWWPAIAHAVTYGLPFLLVTHSPLALLVIVGTHALIDRYRLARHVVWGKNQLAPKSFRPAHTPTGHEADRPDWLAVWLLIIADNIIHMLINVGAVVWLLSAWIHCDGWRTGCRGPGEAVASASCAAAVDGAGL